jgi:hypothetical protein
LAVGDRAVLYLSFDVRRSAPGHDIELDVHVLHQPTTMTTIKKFKLE